MNMSFLPWESDAGAYNIRLDLDWKGYRYLDEVKSFGVKCNKEDRY
jgi:hypothetical protein